MLVAALIAAAPPSPAAAHAFPTAERPAVGSTVTSSPPEVTITFDRPIEALFATIEVLDSGGKNHALGRPTLDASGRRLSVPLKPLQPGQYTVRWSVAAKDSHRTKGSYVFTLSGGG